MSVEQSIPTESTTELTWDEIWDRRDEALIDGFTTPGVSLIEALPGAGKSYGVPKWAARTGNKITVLAPHHILLNEYEEHAKELDLSVIRIASFHRHCESYETDENGDPVTELAEQLGNRYDVGETGKSLHQQSSSNGGVCPKGSDCQYMERLEITPSDYDVLLGHYSQGYASKYTEDRYVAIDEFPGNSVLKKFDTSTLNRNVSNYLSDEQELPFLDVQDLNAQRLLPEHQDDIEEWIASSAAYDASVLDRIPNPSTDALAPLMTMAALTREPMENRWRRAELPGGIVAVHDRHGEGWSFLRPLSFEDANGVVALDGTPSVELWDLVVTEDIEHKSLLNDAEKKEFINDLLGIDIIQTSERAKPYQSGEWVTPPKDMAVFEAIKHREQRTPVLISSKNAIALYDEKGLAEITSKTANYGGLKGINKFGTERLGIVAGNPFIGDDEIEMWAAFAGEPIDRLTEDGERTFGNKIDFGPYGNVYEVLVHHEVLQAVMRFGREEVNGERGATVYVHTSALPDWVPVEKQIPEVHSWLTKDDGMRDTREAVEALDGWRQREWKATELYDHTSISEKQVRNWLESLAEEGYLEFCGKKGQGGSLHYMNSRLEEAGTFGHVEFPEMFRKGC